MNDYGNRALNNHSLTLEASRVVLSGPGELLGFTVLSTKVAAQFIQLFDAQTLPADGAVPDWVVTVAASSDREFAWIPARWHTRGIVVCNSSTAATKTIGSADCFFDFQYVLANYEGV